IQSLTSILQLPILLPAEQIDAADVYGKVITKDRDDDSQAYNSFCGGYSQSKEYENLPVNITVIAAERQKRKIYCIQHKLNTHKNNNCVLTDKNTNNSDCE